MDTASAFVYGQIHRHAPVRVFDWLKAAQIIQDRLVIGNIQTASAGLEGDWEWTGGYIFRDGKVVPCSETYTYLASTWATPQLEIDGQYIECWVWQKEFPNWEAETYWPPEALEILELAVKTTEK